MRTTLSLDLQVVELCMKVRYIREDAFCRSKFISFFICQSDCNLVDLNLAAAVSCWGYYRIKKQWSL